MREELEHIRGRDLHRILGDHGEERLQIEGHRPQRVRPRPTSDELQIPIHHRIAQPIPHSRPRPIAHLIKKGKVVIAPRCQRDHEHSETRRRSPWCISRSRAHDRADEVRDIRAGTTDPTPRGQHVARLRWTWWRVVVSEAVHSDRGSQMRSRAFQRAPTRHSLVDSIGQAGSAADNAAGRASFRCYRRTSSTAAAGPPATTYASPSSPGSSAPTTAADGRRLSAD